MNRSKGTSSLLFATVLAAACVAACSPGDPAKPDLPSSVSPGWTMRKMEASATPERLPQTGTPPICWKTEYAGEGEVTVFVCGYRVSAAAFEAVQRMQSAAHEVKFQKGVYLTVVRWGNVSQAGLTALIGAIQRRLPDR